VGLFCDNSSLYLKAFWSLFTAIIRTSTSWTFEK